MIHYRDLHFTGPVAYLFIPLALVWWALLFAAIIPLALVYLIIDVWQRRRP